MGICGARRKLLRARPLVPKRKLSTNDRGRECTVTQAVNSHPASRLGRKSWHALQGWGKLSASVRHD